METKARPNQVADAERKNRTREAENRFMIQKSLKISCDDIAPNHTEN